MGYRGSRIITVRVPAELEAAIMEDLARLQSSAKGAPPTLTQWLLAAIRERVRQNDPARRRKKKEVTGD